MPYENIGIHYSVKNLLAVGVPGVERNVLAYACDIHDDGFITFTCCTCSSNTHVIFDRIAVFLSQVNILKIIGDIKCVK